MTTDADVSVPRRGRRISPERSEHILVVVAQMLEGGGYDQLRMQDVADRAGVSLATIYRRWPTKQEVVRASLERAPADPLVSTGDARADVAAFLRGVADELAAEGVNSVLGFLAAIRSDPDVAQAYRDTKIQRVHAHLRALLAQEYGADHPMLDLLSTTGPAVLVYRSAVCGDDADDVVEELVELLFAALPG